MRPPPPPLDPPDDGGGLLGLGAGAGADLTEVPPLLGGCDVPEDCAPVPLLDEAPPEGGDEFIDGDEPLFPFELLPETELRSR